jgi:nitrogenase-stabilizing/protective protein
MSLSDEFEALETAEDFLAFFGVAADPAAVRVSRLHILQRFHVALEAAGGPGLIDDEGGFDRAKALLEKAYAEATSPDPEAKRVFKIHRLEAERAAARFVSLDSISGWRGTAGG